MDLTDCRTCHYQNEMYCKYWKVHCTKVTFCLKSNCKKEKGEIYEEYQATITKSKQSKTRGL